jgi:hypothetical protein
MSSHQTWCAPHDRAHNKLRLHTKEIPAQLHDQEKDAKSDHMPEHGNYLDEELKTVSAQQPESFE